jgi:hypothetical protein
MPVDILVVTQAHMLSNLGDSGGYLTDEEQVASSQFHVAQTVLAHPNAKVVHEGYSKHIHQVSPKVKNEIELEFPDNFPAEYDSLTNNQKDILAKYGACKVLLTLGKIDSIHPSESQTTKEENRKKAQKGDFTFTFGSREKEAVEHCIKVGEDKGEVLLIFGDNHDFDKLKDKYKDRATFQGRVNTTDQRITIKTDFISARVNDVISAYTSRSKFKPLGNSAKAKDISDALARANKFFKEGKDIDIQSFLTYRENGKPSIKDSLEKKRIFSASNAYNDLIDKLIMPTSQKIEEQQPVSVDANESNRYRVAMKAMKKILPSLPKPTEPGEKVEKSEESNFKIN